MFYTSEQLQKMIEAHESFSVASESERVVASRIAKILAIPYHTRRDGQGGFYIVHINLPARRNRKAVK
jgi:hypothetical protein